MSQQVSVLNESSVIVAARDQTSAGLPGETVILNPKSGKYYGLDEVGNDVWNLVQRPITVKSLKAAIMQQYDVAPDRCERDLQTLLQDLAAAGLIEIRDEAS